MYEELQKEGAVPPQKSRRDDFSLPRNVDEDDNEEVDQSRYPSVSQSRSDPFVRKRGRPKKYRDPFEDSKGPDVYANSSHKGY